MFVLFRYKTLLKHIEQSMEIPPSTKNWFLVLTYATKLMFFAPANMWYALSMCLKSKKITMNGLWTALFMHMCFSLTWICHISTWSSMFLFNKSNFINLLYEHTTHEINYVCMYQFFTRIMFVSYTSECFFRYIITCTMDDYIHTQLSVKTKLKSMKHKTLFVK